jgi:nicotinamidase-related amidase
LRDPTVPEERLLKPEPVTLKAEETALFVLEMSEFCADPDYMAAPMVPGINRLLERARSAGIVIMFTIPQQFLGQPHGKVYSGFHRKPSEAVFITPHFDKFYASQLQSFLSLYYIKTLILTGVKANMAVQYTATHAVTEYKYELVIPIDGIAATTDYEKEYTLYQFRRYPGESTKHFAFTELDLINFR